MRRRENTFLRLLRRQAVKTHEGVDALAAFLAEGGEPAAEAVKRCEREGDEIRGELIDELHRSFVTPFDREDIFDLSLHIDDVLDYAWRTVQEMRTLRVDGDEVLSDMVERLRQAAEGLQRAMELIERDPMDALEEALKVKQREKQIEKIYRAGVAELFTGPEEVSHVLALLRRREVYRHVSNAGDRADWAANVISSVVVKMT
jgi:predicted phosphate transport protein (TIGR00153 family)